MSFDAQNRSADGGESLGQSTFFDGPARGDNITSVLARLAPQAHEAAQVGEDANMSVSTTFYPGAFELPHEQDVMLVSLDLVFFYVHSAVMLARSSNGFAWLLSDVPSLLPHCPLQFHVAAVPETSPVLNIVLHAVYNKSCAEYEPADADVIAAVDRFGLYGLDVQQHLAPQTALFEFVATRVPSAPLAFYALAGCYDLNDLGVRASGHLLGHRVRTIPVELVERMGPVYLKRLISLQLARQDMLRVLLVQPPEAHPFDATCGQEEQSALRRAWQLVAAYLIGFLETGTVSLFGPEFRGMLSLLVVIGVILVRPEGLYGREFIHE